MSEITSQFQAAHVPRWSGPTLFLSSSSDVREERLALFDFLKAYLDRLETDVAIQPWEWESSVATRPFDQRCSMQEDLGRPADVQCVGTLCVFGERIGHPLVEFRPELLSTWPAWSDPSQPFHAVHPWPTTLPEQLQACRNGGFPVTGTVFEALDALAAGRPVHLACFANQPIDGPEDQLKLHGHVWRESRLAELTDPQEASDWLEGEYAVQRQSVINFLRALAARNRHVPFYRDRNEARNGVQDFVRTHWASDRNAIDNPYRFLDFFDITDHRCLVGREDMANRIVNLVRERASQGGTQPLAIRLSGPSGCGKTSFMRAGVLGRLELPAERGRFRVLAVRPTDFHDEQGQPHDVVRNLLGILARDIADLEIPAADLVRIANAGPKAPQLAVNSVAAALRRADDKATPKFLVLGLDQFEEIVDDLSAPSRSHLAVNWMPLLQFVELASQTDRFACLFTLESSRTEAFNRLKPRLPKLLGEARNVPLGGHDDDFLERVIRVPFERAGYRLAAEVVDRLLQGYRNYARNCGDHVSTLPLLALKLSNLFDAVQAIRALPAGPAAHGLSDQFQPRDDEIGAEELGAMLVFDNDIEELANSAWGASDSDEAEQIDQLNYLLQPLVALNLETRAITLQTVGDSLYADSGAKLQAFEQVRLVVREGGRRRLVHAAVIDQWSLARKWRDQQARYLKEVARLRLDANDWIADGREPAQLPDSQDAIDLAAAVLRHNLHVWPKAQAQDLPPADKNLREFCLAVFERSETPRRSDEKRFRRSSHHVHLAAHYGLCELLARLIERDPDCFDLRDSRQRTPLMCAAWFGLAPVQLLLDRGAEAAATDEEGWTAISAAVWQADDATFRCLAPHHLEAADIRAPAGMSLLHVAARRGAVEIARALVRNVAGADPCQPCDAGWRPLDYATAYDQVEAFQYFLEFHPDELQAPPALSVLHRACANGSRRIVETLLTMPAVHPWVDAPAPDGMTPLMLASGGRYERLVRRLLQAADPARAIAADKPKAGWTALHFAIKGTSEERETRISRQQALATVSALLEVPETDPMARTAANDTPLSLATDLPQVRRLLLLHPRFQHNQQLGNGRTPLHQVIEQRDRLAVEAVLRMPDVDVDAVSADGTHTVALLIEHDMPDLALRLLESGRSRPWQAAGAQDVGLAAATGLGDERLFQALMTRSPDKPDAPQRAMLNIAAREAIRLHRASRLTMLLERGAQPAAIDRRGKNLFHIAALSGNLQAFDELLVRVPWGPSWPDHFGRKPAELAPDALAASFLDRQQFAPAVPEHLLPGPATAAPAAPPPDTPASRLVALAQLGDLNGFIELLTQPDTDPWATDAWGRTPADHAPDAVAAAMTQALLAQQRQRQH